MNSRRATNRIAEISWRDGVVFGKDFDAVRQTRAFHRHSQPPRQIVDIDSALTGQQWSCQEDPEMASSVAHLQRACDPVLTQVELEL